jgi:hypothetical protein
MPTLAHDASNNGMGAAAKRKNQLTLGIGIHPCVSEV